jgi:probable F420-dependent oxidoreductase
VRLGVGIFATDESIGVVELARAAEERGFDSLWLPDHTHIPVSRESPYPVGDGQLPREYARTLDPFVALAAAAQATERLLVGFGVCLLIERDPIVTAKQVATLDLLSGGRVLFGVGAGWNREEMRNHGTDPARRFGLLRERVGALRAIWTEEQASFDGEQVQFDPIWCWPKPLRPGHPPVLVGGNGAKVLERVLAYGDGWIPNASSDPARLPARMHELRQLLEEAGRPPLPVTAFSVPVAREHFDACAAAGAERAVSWLPSAPRAQALEALEALAAAGAPYLSGALRDR